MGLDMYLYLKKYESKSKWKEENIEGFYPSELKALGNMLFENFSISKTTKYKVAYWRKANAIHKWFVDNIGEGIDECQEMYVGIKNLKNLVNTCEKILENPSLASKLLPTSEGFFFGSTEYDKWYIEELKYTIDTLKEIINVLEKNEDYDCIYQASW